MVQFNWMDQWNYVVMYRTFQRSGTTAHIEITAFNQAHFVRLVFVFNETYYADMEQMVAQMIDTFEWDRFSGLLPRSCDLTP